MSHGEPAWRLRLQRIGVDLRTLRKCVSCGEKSVVVYKEYHHHTMEVSECACCSSTSKVCLEDDLVW